MSYEKEAINYLKGWQEGDNITITADFCNYVEEVEEQLNKYDAELKLYQGALKSEHEAIHRANDLEDKLEKYKKILKILKDKLSLRPFYVDDDENCCNKKYALNSSGSVILEKNEYDFLMEVINDENI